MPPVLLITDRSIEQTKELRSTIPEKQELLVLDVSNSGNSQAEVDGWRQLDAGTYFDPDRFREDFVRFLEAVPTRQVLSGKSLDQLFKRLDGYSLWWTSAGATRNPNRYPVKEMQTLWIVNKVIESTSPEAVIVDCVSPRLTQVLKSRCQASRIPVEHFGEAMRPRVGVRWLLSQFRKAILAPWKDLVVCCAANVFLRGAIEQPKDKQQPAVCFRPRITRGVEFRDGVPVLPFWEDFCARLREFHPEIAQRHLIRQKKGDDGTWGLIKWLHREGGAFYGQFPGAVLPAVCFFGGMRMLSSIPRQLLAAWRFIQLNQSSELGRAFEFARGDTSSLYLPLIQSAIESMVSWESESVKIEKALRASGNIKAVMVLAEFYSGVMPGIAATRRLGICTIGVQHGTIMPMHLVYTVPLGHVENAPIPDYFAAYGPYAKSIVSEIGCYPKERVWEVGSARLDYLIETPPRQAVVREMLGLPIGKSIILVATQTYPWFPQAVRAVFEAVKDREDCVVVIKTHFGDRKRSATYQRLAESVGLENVKIYTDQFNELLAASDALVSASSTTILEATLLGIPTVCVNYSDEPDRYPYVQDGASLPGADDRQVDDSICKILSGRENGNLKKIRDDFLIKHAGPSSSGRGTSALLEKVLEVLA